jgi:hypothetical protein
MALAFYSLSDFEKVCDNVSGSNRGSNERSISTYDDTLVQIRSSVVGTGCVRVLMRVMMTLTH